MSDTEVVPKRRHSAMASRLAAFTAHLDESQIKLLEALFAPP